MWWEWIKESTKCSISVQFDQIGVNKTVVALKKQRGPVEFTISRM